MTRIANKSAENHTKSSEKVAFYAIYRTKYSLQPYKGYLSNNYIKLTRRFFLILLAVQGLLPLILLKDDERIFFFYIQNI